MSLETALADASTISVPYAVSDEGHFYIMAEVQDAVERPFIIDTGATQSVIYESTARDIDLTALSNIRSRVSGMIGTKTQPVARLPFLRIGQKSIENLLVAILPDSQNAHLSEGRIAGLIGLDVLAQYKVLFDPETELVSFAPTNLDLERDTHHWSFIRLASNPYSTDDLGLRFMQVEIGLSQTPALLDTGSALNAINWNVPGLWQLAQRRKDLRRLWELNGAIGSFRPQTHARIAELRVGEKIWKHQEFVVMNFTGLEILQIKNSPMMIAGAPMLKDDAFLIDFPNNELWVQAD